MIGLEEYHKLMKERERQLIWRDEWLEVVNDIRNSEETRHFALLGVNKCEERIREIEDKVMEDVHGNKTS